MCGPQCLAVWSAKHPCRTKALKAGSLIKQQNAWWQGALWTGAFCCLVLNYWLAKQHTHAFGLLSQSVIHTDPYKDGGVTGNWSTCTDLTDGKCCSHWVDSHLSTRGRSAWCWTLSVINQSSCKVGKIQVSGFRGVVYTGIYLYILIPVYTVLIYLPPKVIHSHVGVWYIPVYTGIY